MYFIRIFDRPVLWSRPFLGLHKSKLTCEVSVATQLKLGPVCEKVTEYLTIEKTEKMADSKVKKVLIPIDWISTLVVHSDYLRLLLDYDSVPEATGDGLFELVLPPLLSVQKYYNLFELICNPLVEGARVQVLRLWNLVRRNDSVQYITFFVFFGMEKLLRCITEAAVTVRLKTSPAFLVALGVHYGNNHQAFTYALDLVIRCLGCKTSRVDLINSIIRKDGLLSKRKLRNLIYSQFTRARSVERLKTDVCPVCNKLVRYYYKDHVSGEMPDIKLAHFKPCCGYPVHKECYWSVTVSCSHCDVCNSDLDVGTSLGFLKLSTTQHGVRTDEFIRQGLLKKFELPPKLDVPGPTLKQGWEE